MGYKVLGKTEDLMQGYEPRPGLEGPYNFAGRVVYYDPQEGRYWDPRTDFYLSHAEALQMQGLMPYDQPTAYSGGFVDVSGMSYDEVRRTGRE
jgi:hypothetical protein